MYAYHALKKSILHLLQRRFPGRHIIFQQAMGTNEVAIGVVFSCFEFAEGPMKIVDAFWGHKPIETPVPELNHYADQLSRLGHAVKND